MSEAVYTDVSTFISLAESQPVLDVRAPSEFAKGHIPGAFNLPLFSDDERALVGTLYKNVGRKAAMLAGLEHIGPRMREYVEQIEKITDQNKLLVHCWRGGMRSKSIAWLLGLFDYEVTLLEGGYKSFRQHILKTFESQKTVYILSGKTGSKKTVILNKMSKSEQVIDLEGLAHHKGSSFGAIGQLPQPTQQQFENELGIAWASQNPDVPLWLEDESRHIGQCTLPLEIWQQMRNAQVFFLDASLEDRCDHLMNEYGGFNVKELEAATRRVRERLGGLHTQQALACLAEDDRAGCCAILLEHYYDKTYLHGLSKRPSESIHRIPVSLADIDVVIEQLTAARALLVHEAKEI